MDVLHIIGYHKRPPQLVAEENGFFAREGLEIRFDEATYAPEHNRGMAEGRWDFTLSSADTMIARNTTDGTDYVLFMQAEEGLTATLVGRPGVNSLEQLRGQLLAGDPGDSNLDLVRMKILRMHGIRESDYKIDIIGSSPKRLEAFLAGRVAAAMLTPPSTEKALAAGGTLLARADDYVPGWPLTCGWTRRAWLEGHREIIIRFIGAWAAATDWMMEERNRDAAVRLTMEKEHMDRERAEETCARVVAKARINPSAIRSVMELRIDMGVMKANAGAAEKFYDASCWCAATGLAAPEPAGTAKIL